MMSASPLITPVLFLVFNRPETTQKVFNTIRLARPTKLYIVADGPRKNNLADGDRCAAVRKIVCSVDWDCEVKTQFRDENFGCGKGLTEGINWFFQNETEGIILEDDCLPADSFFRFCAEMLAFYRNDTRIMGIAGNNFERYYTREKEYSYTFSNQTYIWGWATWRRAWDQNDYQMKLYREIKQKRYLHGHYNSIYERDLFEYVFEQVWKDGEKINKKNVWDYQWQFACKINSGLVAVPNQNLIVNLGFGAGGTNTGNVKASDYNLLLEEVTFPLRHPDFVMVNLEREDRTFRLMHTSWISRLKSDLKYFLPRFVVERILKPLSNFFSGKKTIEPIHASGKNVSDKEKVKAYV
jgi:hypothetical protein